MKPRRPSGATRRNSVATTRNSATTTRNSARATPKSGYEGSKTSRCREVYLAASGGNFFRIRKKFGPKGKPGFGDNCRAARHCDLDRVAVTPDARSEKTNRALRAQAPVALSSAGVHAGGLAAWPPAAPASASGQVTEAEQPILQLAGLLPPVLGARPAAAKEFCGAGSCQGTTPSH